MSSTKTGHSGPQNEEQRTKAHRVGFASQKFQTPSSDHPLGLRFDYNNQRYDMRLHFPQTRQQPTTI